MNENKQLDEQFEMGVAVGINLMKEKLLLAAEYKKDYYCKEKHGITSHLFLYFGEQVRHI